VTPSIEMNVLTTSLLALTIVVAETNRVLAAEAASGGNGEVCEIASVTHFDQLRGQRPIRLDANWEVRFGLRDGGAESGPWRLLYCLANWTNKSDPPSLGYEGKAFGEPLGPVFYRVSMGEQAPVAAHARMMFAGGYTPPEGLYCGMVLTAWQGKYHIDVFSRDGKNIASRTIHVDEPRPLHWQEFACREGAVLRSPVAARPEFVGTWPLWENGGKIGSQLQQRCPLPGTIPMPNAWIDYVGRKATAIREGERIYPLTLSLTDGHFVIRSSVNLVDWPDFHLLARWWVNDQPISARRPEGISMREIGRQVSSTKEMRVRFGLPDALGQLEPDDRVALQVLYSPAMIEQVPINSVSLACLRAASCHKSETPAVPMTSNRIEFTVTKAMFLP